MTEEQKIPTGAEMAARHRAGLERMIRTMIDKGGQPLKAVAYCYPNHIRDVLPKIGMDKKRFELLKDNVAIARPCELRNLCRHLGRHPADLLPQKPQTVGESVLDCIIGMVNGEFEGETENDKAKALAKLDDIKAAAKAEVAKNNESTASHFFRAVGVNYFLEGKRSPKGSFNSLWGAHAVVSIMLQDLSLTLHDHAQMAEQWATVYGDGVFQIQGGDCHFHTSRAPILKDEHTKLLQWKTSQEGLDSVTLVAAALYIDRAMTMGRVVAENLPRSTHGIPSPHVH